MWKRDQVVLPTGSESRTPGPPSPPAPTRTPVVAEPRPQEAHVAVPIGKSVVIKGELSGSEDLTVEGSVEGTIELRDNVLTIGPNGKIKAQVSAKVVIVQGKVNGNVTASERVDIRGGGWVEGDVVSPRVAIADGAHFRGSVDMQKKGPQPVKASAEQESAQRLAPADTREHDVQIAGVAH
jgi:cytoskeletal protein CcmA (bactofilin family)